MVSNMPVTMTLPNGALKSVTVSGVAEEVERLASAGHELGYTLMLSVTTLPASEEGGEGRGEPVVRRRRGRPARRAVEAAPVRQQRRRFDVKRLVDAMRWKSFNPRVYAEGVGVNSSLVYYHMRRLKALKALKTQKK